MRYTDDPERYEELMDMPPTELVDEYLILEEQVKRLRDESEERLRYTHHLQYKYDSVCEELDNKREEVEHLRERLRDATDLLHDCEYYICPTCNQWADRNYDCENCEVKE